MIAPANQSGEETTSPASCDLITTESVEEDLMPLLNSFPESFFKCRHCQTPNSRCEACRAKIVKTFGKVFSHLTADEEYKRHEDEVRAAIQNTFESVYGFRCM